ncbi:TetR/AcrR family transcriptional regulator [uncultured Faecalibaculum sp.]|uniref:TetR/AcrR family transcriptional regulator n=1 Tax=uncultured Faecalibaculum sp. TaxID=1729681 RepID=UPI0025DD5E99|nr:TetR/AcrR family transcriptional regulator [uncultured Faecalibaculum sp.]
MKRKTSLAEIADAAFQLFREHGFDNVSVMDICHEVGITKPTFYKFAASKDALLSQYYQGADETVLQEMASLDLAGSYIEEIWAGTSCIMKRSSELGHDLYSHYVIRCLRSHTHPNTTGYELQEHIEEAIRKAQKSGQILNHSDPRKIWLSLTNLFLGTGCQWAFGGGEENVLQQCRHGFLITLRPAVALPELHS